MDKRTQRLETTPIASLLFSFALPAIIGTLVSSTYNIVDRIFVGRVVGEVALGGVTVAYPLMMFLIAFGMMIGHGSSALISIRLGEKNKPEADLILTQAFVLFGLVAAFFMSFGLAFSTKLLRIFGATDSILPYSKDYLSIIFLGAFFHLVSYGMNGQIRSEGNLKWSTVTMVICAVTNIFLDWLFIYIFQMGIKGAALATVTAQALGAVWVLWYYMSGRSVIKMRLAGLWLRFSRIVKVIKTGSPSCVLVVSGCILQGIMLNRIRYFGGDEAISCVGAILGIINVMIYSPLIGIGQGAQPIIGYNYGANLTERVLQTLRITLVSTTVICFLGYVLLMIFSENLMGMFTRSSEGGIATIGPRALRIFITSLPVVGVLFISRIYFLAIGNYRVSIMLTGFRQIVLVIPLLLLLPGWWGLDGIWWAIPLADFGGAVLSGLFIFGEIRRLMTMQAVFEV